MSWDKWYVKKGNWTTYWFATGKKPGLSNIIRRTFYLHRDETALNITKTNGILQKLNEHLPPEQLDTKRVSGSPMELLSNRR